VVVDAEVNETNKTTPGSEQRGLFEKGAALLEMFGYPTNKESDK
jgi:hypothetical protein